MKKFNWFIFFRNTFILLFIGVVSVALAILYDFAILGLIGMFIFGFTFYGISESTQPKYSSILSLIISCIVACFCIPLAFDYKNEMEREEKSRERHIYQENKSKKNYIGEVGTDAYITEDCAAAYSKEWFNEMERYISKGNETAFNEMISNGKLVKLYSGDKVNIIENGIGWTKVEYKGKYIYVIKGMLSLKNQSKGKYINAETGERQGRYGGSQQQKDDLKAIDEYGKNNPDFW